MMTIEQVEKTFREVCDAAGAPCKLPITTNGRLKTTLGRVMFFENKSTGNVFPKCVEFSKDLLKLGEESMIKEIIKHEAAHYIAWYRTKKVHGHDDLFRLVCDELKCNLSKSFVVMEDEADARPFKYTVTCKSCGSVVGEYARMCKTLKNLDRCSCGKCGSAGTLKYVQNF